MRGLARWEIWRILGDRCASRLGTGGGRPARRVAFGGHGNRQGAHLYRCGARGSSSRGSVLRGDFVLRRDIADFHLQYHYDGERK